MPMEIYTLNKFIPMIFTNLKSIFINWTNALVDGAIRHVTYYMWFVICDTFFLKSQKVPTITNKSKKNAKKCKQKKKFKKGRIS